jgi:hypothetical protein
MAAVDSGSQLLILCLQTALTRGYAISRVTVAHRESRIEPMDLPFESYGIQISGFA